MIISGGKGKNINSYGNYDKFSNVNYTLEAVYLKILPKSNLDGLI
jgi:hypothetical protein